VLTDIARGVLVPIEHRAIGYVPQDLALFPHLSVKENLLFGAQECRRDAGVTNRDQQYSHIVEILDIDHLLTRGIKNLSGGEKQRVAFARALLAAPRLLMLDEPLASLDHALKKRMSEYLLQLSGDVKTPMIYVSHEKEEMLQLCTDMFILENGRIIQHGPPASILA